MVRRAVPACLVALAVALAGCAGTPPASLDDGGPTAGSTGTPPAAVVLSPTADPSTSQTFTWRTAGEEGGERVVVTAPDGSDAVVEARRKDATTVRDSGSDLPAWTATVEDLEPGTAYDYRVEDDGGATGTQTFTTPEVEVGTWRFLSLGDTQVDNAGVPADLVQQAVDRFPDVSLVLQAGDLVDRPYEHREWLDALTALAPVRTTRNVVAAIGNHEQCILVRSCRDGDAQGYRAYVTNPDNGADGQRETWFRTDVQGVRFVVLDSFGDDLDAQAAFLEESLATNEQRWTVVLLHAGPFASRTRRTNTAVYSRILPVLERHDVDLVLSGHDHVYSRGYHADPDGTVFATSNSGPKEYVADDADWLRRDATRVRWAQQVSTYQVVDVSEGELRYRAVVAHLGRNPKPGTYREGDVLDEVTISKDAAGVKDVRW